MRIAVPIATYAVGVLTRPWFAFLFGCRIRREDAELARRSLYAAQSVLEMSVERDGSLEHPWTFDGTPLDIGSLSNSFRTIRARCHDRKLCGPITGLMNILPSVAGSTPKHVPGVYVFDEPMPSYWVDNESTNKQSAITQLDASRLGLERVADALGRLDRLERRLTFWEGRLS